VEEQKTALAREAHKAMERLDADALREIGKKWPGGIDRVRVHDQTLLSWAIEEGVETVRVVLAAGADPRTKNLFGEIPLLDATRSQNEAIVREFLALDLVLRAIDQTSGGGGHTALMLAASLGNAKIARLLIEAGADANAKDVAGDSALAIAIENNRPQVVELLAPLTNPRLLDGDMNTAAQMAQKKWRWDCLDNLAPQIDVELAHELVKKHPEQALPKIRAIAERATLTAAASAAGAAPAGETARRSRL
jgi:ankyrin repeat protein